MKVGDLVSGKHTPPPMVGFGLIVGYSGSMAIVYWNDDFREEEEYVEDLEVVSETR